MIYRQKIKDKKLSNRTMCAVIAAQVLFCAGSFANAKSIAPSRDGINKTECQITPLEKSKAMIELILRDLSSTYTQVGGGGISAIKQSHSNIFVVSIAQEERVDQVTYELAMGKACKVIIIKKESSSIGYNH